MTEDEMDERTREALRGYRVPPEPPLDDDVGSDRGAPLRRAGRFPCRPRDVARSVDARRGASARRRGECWSPASPPRS